MHINTRSDEDVFIDSVRSLSLGMGFNEMVSPSLINTAHAELFAPERVVSVLNPVNTERPAMRPSTIPSILEAVSLNCKNGVDSLEVFEIGAIFQKAEEGENVLVAGYKEYQAIGFGISGLASDREWYGTERPYDLFDMKGYVEALLKKLHIANYSFLSSDKSSTLSANRLEVRINGEFAGELVELSKQTLEAFDVQQPVFVAELNLRAMELASQKIARYKPVPKYPVVNRDLAFLLAKSVTAEEITGSIRKAQTSYLKDVRIVDVYMSDSLGNDKKSIAVTMTFQAPDKTLTDAEIDKDLQAITKIVESALHAELRST